MQRIALGVEYNGGLFRGFQVQKHDPKTVQGMLHLALSDIAAEPIELVCAGRTDAGVHASGQVIHFDTMAERPLKAWTMGVNTKLPDQIAVQWSKAVPFSFHARFSAQSRTYRYIILNSPTRPGIQNGLVTWDKRCLDLTVMRQAAALLEGEHDFSSFRAAQCQAKSPVRTIHYLKIIEHSPFIIIEVSANAFLHHMVRNIVGVLTTIAAGEKPLSWVNHVLEARDRCQGGVTAPAAGLYLVNVAYPGNFGLPGSRPGPGFLEIPLQG
ncbi:tRNA pseudouridine(38-40) synthase TruA [Halioxenophilus sp. WMMB6]|uniref:tRNA pseudouridine(38-40) synthase TruA n=1 Tax=Halioxenophilus sp. WMMB6 TaxID=3073815 RepID=UPI00295EF31D|nr:tRNA pseudouridine(38-40) synthase TruA [Halioxenophilus sp. WMMB6]